MDRVQPVSAELEADLINLAAMNRRFGGQATWRFFLKRWLKPGGRYRLLDLATGGGDAPRLMVDFARRIGATVEVTAVDAQPSTLALARKWSVGYPEIEFREGDVRAPDFSGDAPYDFAFFSLALHHFSEADAVAILKKLGGARPARRDGGRSLPRFGVLGRCVADYGDALSRGDVEARCAHVRAAGVFLRGAGRTGARGGLARFRASALCLRAAGDLAGIGGCHLTRERWCSHCRRMEGPEVPTEHLHEEMHHQAHHPDAPRWIMGVALSSALIAGLAAISALLAGHHANEAMLEQIQAANRWSYYQAKSIKKNVVEIED